MELQTISALTSGLESFGEAMSWGGAATAAKQNEALLQMQAKGVMAQSNFVSKRMQEQGSQFISRQRAQYAKAGVTLDGSPLAALMLSEKNLSMDIMMTRLNYAGKANELGFSALQQKIAQGQARTRQVAAIGKGILQIGTALAMQAGTAGGSKLAGQTKAFGGGTAPFAGVPNSTSGMTYRRTL
jgi:hypothetical protein